jgi:hypothetical protein
MPMTATLRATGNIRVLEPIATGFAATWFPYGDVPARTLEAGDEASLDAVGTNQGKCDKNERVTAFAARIVVRMLAL